MPTKAGLRDNPCFWVRNVYQASHVLPGFKAAFADSKLLTIHSYPAMNHAFARVGGQHYDKTSADLANSRTAGIFKKTLS